MKRTLVLVTAMAVGAAVSAATKGSSEATAISLTVGSKEKTTTVQLVQDATTNVEHFVCYYKMTLKKGTAYTIWLDNAAVNGQKSRQATISILPFSIYPQFSFVSPIAMFEAVEVGDSERWVMSGKEWSSTVADDDWGDSSLGSSSSEFDFDWDWKTPNTWTYYIVVQGQKGETATLHYSTGKKIPPGILQNPLVVTPPVLPKTLTTGALKFCSSNYFAQVKFRKGAQYHFSSTGGTAANRLHISYLEADGHAILPGTVRSAAAGYNFNETFVPDKAGTFLLRISSSAENYENATAHLVCGVEPEKAIAKHAVRGLGAGAPVTCRPGNVNAKGSTYFDAIIDEELFSFTAAKGQNYVVETTGATTNLLMRVYDTKGNVLAENTGNGSGLDVRCAIAAQSKATKYYVGVAQNLGYDDDILTATRQPVTLTLRAVGKVVDTTGLQALPKPSDYNANPAVIDVDGVPAPLLGAGNWSDVYAFPARKGLVYALGARWEGSPQTNGYTLVADVYYLKSGKKKAVLSAANVTPTIETEVFNAAAFTAPVSDVFYARFRVKEGLSIDYPAFTVHAVGYRDDSSGAQPGALRVVPKGAPTAKWTLNKETAKYAAGDILVLPAGTACTVKFASVKGFKAVPTSVTTTPVAGTITDVVTYYSDTSDPADNSRKGATTWKVKHNKLSGYKRTLWKNDPADYYLVTSQKGYFYNFSFVTNGCHAAFDIVRSDGVKICENVTSVSKLSLPKAKYYLVVHRDAGVAADAEGDGAYQIQGEYATVGAIGFSKKALSVKDTATSVKLTVKRSAKEGAVSVKYRTQDGTARAGEHYVAQEGVLTWPAGNKSDKSLTIKLVPKAGAWYDGGKKSFSVVLETIPLTGEHAEEYMAQIDPGTCTITRTETSKASVTQTSVYAKAAAKTAKVKKSEVAPLETGVFYGVGCEQEPLRLTNGLPQFASVTLTSTSSKGKTNLTAKVVVAGKTYSFKASGWDAYASEAKRRLLLVSTVNKVLSTNTLDVALSTGSTATDFAWRGAAGDFKLTLNVPDASGKGVQPNIVYAGSIYRRNAGVQAYLNAVKDFAGYYTVALVSREWERTDGTTLNDSAVAASGLPEGRGYLTLTVDNKGTTKVAGLLPDGTKISTSVTAAPLVADASKLGLKLCVPFCCAKSPWTFGGQLEIVAAPLASGEARPDGRAYSLQVTSDAGRLIWNNDNAGATYDAKQGWRCALEPIGGWYDKIVNLQNYYRDYAYEVGTAAISEFPKELLPSGYSYVTAVEMDGLDVTLSGNSLAAPTRKLVKKGKIYDFADDATVNPQNVKVKIARATGLVSGDFSLWTATANGAKQKELKGFKHYGVLTFGRMNGNAIDDLYADAEVLTTGFLLKPVKIPVTKKTTRTWNFSKPFDIVLPVTP